MDFFTAIKTCFTKYVDFKGRASRSEFWYFMLFLAILSLALSTISENLANFTYLITFLPCIFVGTRRLHDIGRTGWWQLIMLTGIGLILLIYWWVQEGEAQPNMYGENPLTS